MMVKKGYKETILGIMPEDWDIKQVQGIGKIVTGTTPSTKKDEYYGNKYKFITPSDINDSKYIRETERYLSEEGLNVSRPIPENSVMVTCIASIGKNAITREKACTNQQINSIVCKDDIEANYVYYSMNYRARYLRALSGKTAVPIVNKGEFSTFLLPLPSYIEQKKIADILSTVDENIEKTERMIEKTKELKKGLMQQLLTKGIGHSEFKEVRIGIKKYHIPINWQVKTMNEMAKEEKYSLVDGPFGSNLKTDDYRNNGEIRLIQLQNIKPCLFNNEEKKYTHEQKYKEQIRSSAKPGDIVLAKMPDPIGRACMVPDLEDKYLVVADVIKFTPKISYYNEFSMYFFNGECFRNQVESYATGSTRLRLNLSTFKDIELLVPPLKEQKKIANILSTVDEKIQKEKEYKDKLEELKKGLMQKLLTGEVRVKVAN